MSPTVDENSQSLLAELEKAEPTDFLTPSDFLSGVTRGLSKNLFQSTARAVQEKLQERYTGLKELHADGFDPEQIWLQLDLLHAPTLSSLRKNIAKAVKKIDSDENVEFFRIPEVEKEEVALKESVSEDTDSAFGDDIEEDGEETVSDSEEGNEDDDSEDNKQNGAKKLPFEDKFFSVEDMEKFLEQAEAEDGNDIGKLPQLYEEGDVLVDEEEDEDDEEEEDDENDEDADAPLDASEIRYDDFFGSKALEKVPKEKKKKVRFSEEDIESDAIHDGADAVNKAEDTETNATKEEPLDKSKLSSHELRQLKLQEQARELEEVNLNPKNWSLQGEVVSADRPKNSALEVELDFEHASRPPPVITEQVTATLEELIKARIAEQRFDDVERKQLKAMEAAPRERIELDDSQSGKGLAEIYEAEYSLAAGLTAAAPSTTDKLKHEAAVLFKELCSKLDGLSHFHFTPKPIIEDTSVRVDVPAIAMEEVAPVAVSQASLLAPEEVFAGGSAAMVKGEGGSVTGLGLGGVRGSARGQVKAEGEVSREEKKRRHRKVKRKWSKVNLSQGAPASVPKKAKEVQGEKKGVESGPRGLDFTKSTQVFAKLQEGKAHPELLKKQKEEVRVKSAKFKL